MDVKFYFSSVDGAKSREVIIAADSCYRAITKLWQRELLLLKAIPKDSIVLWDPTEMLLDPVVRVHRGQAKYAGHVPTSPVWREFSEEDQRLIREIMNLNWFGGPELQRFEAEVNFFR